MPNTKLMTGRDLGKAICAHLGLNANLVQSDYQIKTDPGELASVALTVLLTADDLAGIARVAGADDGGASTFTIKAGLDVAAERARLGDILRCYGLGGERSEVSALAAEIRQLRKGIQERPHEIDENTKRSTLGAEMIQGEALALEPDPRLDEVVSLLKQLVDHAKRERAARYMTVAPVCIVEPGV